MRISVLRFRTVGATPHRTVGFPGALPGKSATIVPAFRQGLSEAGYVERRNVTIEGRRPAA